MLVLVGIPLGLALDAVVPGILVLYGAGLAWWGVATLRQLRAGERRADDLTVHLSVRP